MIIEILGIKETYNMLFICGILAMNSMITYANATYIYLSDIYMLSLLCAVAGVFLVKKGR